MLQTSGYLRDYFRAEAQGWEAATYLKVRPIAGNRTLGAEALTEVRQTLLSRFRAGPGAVAELARQLVHTRERLEKEGTGPRAKGEFKKLSGGYYDIEYLLAFLFLVRSPELSEPAHPLQQIGALEATGLLERSAARALRNAALLYRGLDHALRVITGRPAHRLPEPAFAERATVLLHEWGIPVESTLEETVSRARRQVRQIYEQMLSPVAGVPRTG